MPRDGEGRQEGRLPGEGRFTLRLLGAFALEDGAGRVVPLPTRKARLLLAYLASPAGQSHAREKLAALLWPDRSEEQARGSLRNALAALRAALGPEAIESGPEGIALRPGSLVTDVEAIGAGPLPETLDREFLEGFDSAGGEALDDWLRFERDRCRTRAQEALEATLADAIAAGDGASAMALGRRLLALDPLRERSHRRLAEACLAAGERAQAAAQLRACRELLRRELGVEPSAETERLERMVAAPAPSAPAAARHAEAPAMPEPRFAIAVLPFAAVEQDAFIAEGFAEDLVTELSRRRDFLVIARQSSRLFPGHRDGAAAAATELGARFALTGSLRRAGDALRATAQLLDSGGRRCIWAERYDGSMAGLFALQDEITARVLGAVDAEVREAERERAARAAPEDLDAWALFHRGLWHMYRFTPADIAEAEAAWRAALARAPRFGLPHAGLGYAAYVRAIWFLTARPEAALAEALAASEEAVRLDPDSAFCQTVLGRVLVPLGEVPRALHHLEQAVASNPGYAKARFGLGQGLAYAGRHAEALQHLDLALRLSPRDPLAGTFQTARAFSLHATGAFQEAEAAARDALRRRPNEGWAGAALALALIAQGREAEARRAVLEACARQPGLTLGAFARLLRPAEPEGRARVLAALRRAGLPEA